MELQPRLVAAILADTYDFIHRRPFRIAPKHDACLHTARDERTLHHDAVLVAVFDLAVVDTVRVRRMQEKHDTVCILAKAGYVASSASTGSRYLAGAPVCETGFCTGVCCSLYWSFAVVISLW